MYVSNNGEYVLNFPTIYDRDSKEYVSDCTDIKENFIHFDATLMSYISALMFRKGYKILECKDYNIDVMPRFKSHYIPDETSAYFIIDGWHREICDAFFDKDYIKDIQFKQENRMKVTKVIFEDAENIFPSVFNTKTSTPIEKYIALTEIYNNAYICIRDELN